ncbi:MAG: hypothetical protein E6G77_25290 [Alphaproteobacteria bacterium]|nr:MAG: hypothetical protein E6G77_25290 [Alphaproteobacteria bacterium]
MVLVLALSCLADIFANSGATAQTIYFGVHDIALKNGESSELAQVYYIGTNCKSLLKAPPEVEILDGPPGVTAVINDAKVVPRGLGCASPVPGGKLVISAQGVEDYSRTRMVLRIKLKTSLGDRQYTHDVNISLFP